MLVNVSSLPSPLIPPVDFVSLHIQKTLVYVDTFARDLQLEVEARNLTHIVDIVFVSDHGMTDTSHPELIYMDDILGEGFQKIEHEDGTYFRHSKHLHTSLIDMH